MNAQSVSSWHSAARSRVPGSQEPPVAQHSGWSGFSFRVAAGLLGLLAAASGCRNQCHHWRLIEVHVPGHRDCACRTAQPAAVQARPEVTAPVLSTPAPAPATTPELPPAAAKPEAPRPHSILAGKSSETSPSASQFTPPGSPNRAGQSVQSRSRSSATDPSSRRVNVYTTGTAAGTGIAGSAGPDNSSVVAEPELIAQLPVQPAGEKSLPDAEQLAELDAEILEATEPLATPPVIDELHGPLVPPVNSAPEVSVAEPAASSADEATRIAAGIATTAAASATELQIAAEPVATPIETAVVTEGPVVLRAIAPETLIRPVGTPAFGPGLHALPVGFQRPVPAFQPAAPASFPLPGSATPLGPTLIPQPVFRELPFHGPATRILKATADSGRAAAGQPVLPAASVANSASIVSESAAPGTQR